MMTPEREAEIRARCERATPGPWRKIKNISGDFDIGTELSRAVPRVAFRIDADDATFIAHAHQDISDLLEALCEARQKLRALEDGLEKWREAAERNREIDEAQYRGR